MKGKFVASNNTNFRLRINEGVMEGPGGRSAPPARSVCPAEVLLIGNAVYQVFPVDN